MLHHNHLPVIEVGEGEPPRGHAFLWTLLTLLVVSAAVSAWVIRFSAAGHSASYGEVSVTPPTSAEKERMLESLSEGASAEGEAERLLALEALADGKETPEISLEEMREALDSALGSAPEEQPVN